AGQHALTEKVAWTQDGDDRLSADPGQHRNLDGALLNVFHDMGGVALRKNHLVSRIAQHATGRADCRQVRFRVESRDEDPRRRKARALALGWSLHRRGRVIMSRRLSP